MFTENPPDGFGINLSDSGFISDINQLPDFAITDNTPNDFLTDLDVFHHTDAHTPDHSNLASFISCSDIIQYPSVCLPELTIKNHRYYLYYPYYQDTVFKFDKNNNVTAYRPTYTCPSTSESAKQLTQILLVMMGHDLNQPVAGFQEIQSIVLNHLSKFQSSTYSF